MKLVPLYAVIALASAIIATPATADDSTILFKFDGGIGSQPFRSANGVASPNTVAGVNPGGTPWPIKSLKAKIKTDGTIHAEVKGILLGGGDNIGTRGGSRQMVVSLFCRNAPAPGTAAGTLQTVPYNSSFVDLDPNGDFELTSTLTNASGATPPTDCGDNIDNRPALLIRTVNSASATNPVATPGSWFAAGILDD